MPVEARLTGLVRAALPGDQTVGVALSGGGDSVALLHLCRVAGLTVEAVTVDHALRAESAAEAAVVAGDCAALGVRHEVRLWRHGAVGGNLMDAARRARVGLIRDWAVKRGIGVVALGHTRDDQAETLVMGLARAAGIDGLAGMRPAWVEGGVRFVRPLLEAGRAELRAWLEARGIAWIDDPTNENDRFARVRARKALAVMEPLGISAEGLAVVARNLAEGVFGVRAGERGRFRTLGAVEDAAHRTSLLRASTTYRLDQLDRFDRQLLHERHLVSKELAGLDGDRPARPGAALLYRDGLSAMVNEEDHLRLQTLVSGFALEDAYRRVDALDRELGQQIPFAFHPEFGYLTSCPTNVGTGLRASVLIHLPGLVLTKEISKVLQGLAQVGLTFRGLYGEGSEVVGNFFQLSNQTTLGKSEPELLDHLGKMVRQVMRYEEQARRVLLRWCCHRSVVVHR